MRPVEIFNLRKINISPDKNGLQVTRSKTKASIRRVPLSDKAKLILEGRLNRFDDGFLFPQNDINGSAPTKALEKLHRQVIGKLEYKFRLYDCRHTFATRAFESGTDL